MRNSCCEVVSTLVNNSALERYLLEIRLIVRVDIVNLNAAILVVLEVPDDLVRISLAPVARLASSVGNAAQ